MTKAQKIASIYARIPKLDCQRKCQECCGPIMCSAEEWRQMKSSALVSIDQMAPNLTCPALVNGVCSVYDVRPLICRLWGVVREMACPHGCVPERWLSDQEARKLLKEMAAISGGEVAGPTTRGSSLQRMY